MRRAHLAPVAVLLLVPGASVLGQAEAPAAKPAAATPAKPAAAARPAARPTKDSLTAIRERGRLVACVAPQVPWTIQLDEGQFTGFSVDVAKQLAEDLGVEVLGPIVADANSYPSLPAEGDPLTITARVTPSFGPVASVQLRYRVMFDAEVAIPLLDDSDLFALNPAQPEPRGTVGLVAPGTGLGISLHLVGVHRILAILTGVYFVAAVLPWAGLLWVV